MMHSLLSWVKTTTDIKKANNNNAKHTIGYKVDGRILCKIDATNEVLDICQIEAAKTTETTSKIITDRAKLAIESKCIIEDTINKPIFFLETRQISGIQNVQICGIQAQVNNLSIIDEGLYVYVKDFNMSFEADILTFPKNYQRGLGSLYNSKIAAI